MTLLQRSAGTIVAVCAAVNASETVLIVTDFETEACAKLLAEAARSAGAIVNVETMPPRNLDGQEPTAAVAASMKSAGVVLPAVQKSPAHTLAVKESLAGGRCNARPFCRVKLAERNAPARSIRNV